MFFPILLVFLMGASVGGIVTAENQNVENFIEHKVLQEPADESAK